MGIAILYLVTLAVFLGLDFLGLSYLVKPFFDERVGSMLRDSPRYLAALLFYLGYVGGVLYFVSLPALGEGWSLSRVFLSGAALGALAYGTYEFTNYATLKGWTPGMVALDLCWGAILTGTAALAGVAAARAWG